MEVIYELYWTLAFVKAIREVRQARKQVGTLAESNAPSSEKELPLLCRLSNDSLRFS